MNQHLFTSVTLAIVAIFATLPSASGFALLSPVLLRVNPAGVAARMNNLSPSTSSPVTNDSLPIISSSKASTNSPASINRPPSASVDFGLDEDMMRYKHELLSAVYERSLTRGFE